MILSDASLAQMLPTLLSPYDHSLVNPASVDIRIGKDMLLEVGRDQYEPVDLSSAGSFLLRPGAFALVGTYERITVPNGYVLELRLKSSMARRGWDHSLAFWFDPGWSGIGTLEIKNQNQYTPLPLEYMMRFGQVIVHILDQPASRPYQGRYQGANSVEAAKQ